MVLSAFYRSINGKQRYKNTSTKTTQDFELLLWILAKFFCLLPMSSLSTTSSCSAELASSKKFGMALTAEAAGVSKVLRLAPVYVRMSEGHGIQTVSV